MDWFHFLIFVVGPFVILMASLNFPSPFLDVIRMSTFAVFMTLESFAGRIVSFDLSSK